MRILFSHRVGSRDGQSVHIEELVGALRQAGHEVLVVGPGLYDRARFGGESGVVARIRRYLPRAVSELAELAYNLPAYRRLDRACRSFHPDIIYERYNLFYLAGMLLARRHGLPFYLEVNAPLVDERSRFGGLSLAGVARASERWVWRSADRVLTVTEVLKARVMREAIPEARVGVVHNGIVPERFARPTPRVGADAVVLGFVGFVRDWHGLDGVIAGMAAIQGPPEIRLTVVGEGPARAGLQRQAALFGIANRVHFAGLADRASIPGLIGGFDIALQPRVVDYASPLKLFEYMAAARAIVAPDQANIREILTDGETALLFDPRRKGAMWEAISRLIGNADLRRKLGEAARDTIAQRGYTWIGNAERIAAWVRADLERRSTPRKAVFYRRRRATKSI
jgi:glycosyltransferase involved in cell wall biosynthesis